MNTDIPLSVFSYTEKISFYSRAAADYLCIDAIFSDETDNFVTYQNADGCKGVKIKIRVTRDNTDEIYLHYGNKEQKMLKGASDSIFFDYYYTDIMLMGAEISYYFTITHGGKEYYYNKRGLYDYVDLQYNFVLLADFVAPKWAKGAVMYQIFVDRFCNGDPTNDVINNEYAYLGRAAKKIDNWNAIVSNDDICNFYGGDLQGVIEKMPYLKDLGIDAIYFNPLFVSPSSHKYDIQDFDYIDPHFGVIENDGGEQLFFEKFHNKYATKYKTRTTTLSNLEASNALMIKLIECAHQNGIKVILDGVFNHCGSFNKWLDKEGFYSGGNYPPGAYKDEKSPYKNFFRWYDSNWPNNDCYDSWWGHDNHPKLNYEKSYELYNYILEVGKKWVSPPYNADGWRLDVAADLGYSLEFNHKFWKDFRRAVKEANPDALILAEHYGDPSKWLQGDEWDTIMNYDAFMEPISWFLTGMEKHSEQYRQDLHRNAMFFETSMRAGMAKLPLEALLTSMNELSNHDHSRFLTRTNSTAGKLHTMSAEEADRRINKSIFYEAVVFQMTWPGSPTIYYGDEAGMTGWTDPDNRRTYPWGREDRNMIKFHKELIRIRKAYDVLKTGSVEFLYSRYGIASYGRWDSETKIVVILNNNDNDQKLSIPVWKIDARLDSSMQLLIHTHSGIYSTDTLSFPIVNGFLNINMLPYSSAVLVENR